MDPRFKTNLLEHAKAAGDWARRRAALTSIDPLDLSLSVRLDGRSVKLFAQFVGRRDGERLSYFDQPDRFAIGFVGWLPYKPLTWDLSLSKQAFKSAVRPLGLSTPRQWDDGEAIDAPFLIKRDRGAFGEGMRGPFAAADGATVPVAEGEYAEAFISGHIARAWYWNETLCVLELFPMPAVEGDGRRDLGTLIRERAGSVPPGLEPLLALQGCTLESVPLAGTVVTCDYRYVSPLNPTVYANHNRLPRLRGSPIAQRFEEAGRLLRKRLPLPPGQQIGFVLDAIVDGSDQPWLLEINSNPQGHPDQIATMLDGLFGLAPPR